MAKRLLDPMPVRLSPQMRKRLDELTEERGESIAVLIREALDHTYGPQDRAPEPWPQGATCDPLAVPQASCPEPF